LGLPGSDDFGDGMAEDNRLPSLPKSDLAPPPLNGLRLLSRREFGGRSRPLCGGDGKGDPFGVVRTTAGRAGLSVGEMTELSELNLSKSPTVVTCDSPMRHLEGLENGSANFMVLDR
jgi:hypothetical protein